MAEIVANIAAVLEKEIIVDGTMIPYLLAVFGTHAVVEYVVPAVAPKAFAFLGLKDGTVDPKKLAVDARTKTIAILFSLHVASLALWALGGGSLGSTAVTIGDLEVNPYAVSPLTYHILRCASAYFIWDIFVCALDGYDAIWWVHALCCFCVFTSALNPFLHYMSIVCLLFEASTPFLHIRAALIQSRSASGTGFAIVQALFGLTFFLTRIVFGYWKCWGPGQWNDRMQALVASGDAHSVQVVRMFQVSCAILSCMNAYWIYGIVGAAFRGEKKKPVPGGPAETKKAA